MRTYTHADRALRADQQRYRHGLLAQNKAPSIGSLFFGWFVLAARNVQQVVSGFGFSLASICAEQIAGEDLVTHILYLIGQSVGDNQIRRLLEFFKIVDHR